MEDGSRANSDGDGPAWRVGMRPAHSSRGLGGVGVGSGEWLEPEP